MGDVLNLQRIEALEYQLKLERKKNEELSRKIYFLENNSQNNDTGLSTDIDQEYFKSLSDNIPVLVWATNANAECTYINKQWCDYTNTTLEENLGMGWLNCVHPEDLEQAGKIFLEANEKRMPFELLYRLKRYDGEYRWSIDSGLPRFDKNKNFLGYLGTVTDIHQVKTAEDILKENEQLLEIKVQERTIELENERSALRELFFNTPAIICILRGPEHIFEFTNPGYRKLYGFRPLDGIEIRKALPEIEGQGFFELLDDVYQNKKPFIGSEMQAMVDSNNNGVLEELYFNLIYHPIFDKSGNSVGITVFAFEITEQVRARKEVEKLNDELKKSETKYRNLAESLELTVQERTRELLEANKKIKYHSNKLNNLFMNAPAAISIFHGPKYEFELVNSFYRALIGNREYIGKTVEDIIPEVKEQGLIDILDNVYKTGLPFLGNEYPVMLDRKGNGEMETVYFNFVYQPIFNSENKVEGISTYAFDVSSQVIARKEIEKLVKELAESNQELERFNYIASHDLQSPLRTISSYSKLLQRRYQNQLDDKADSFLETIISASISMKNLIDDLLNYSKVGKEEGRYKTIDLNELIKDIINANKVYIEENRAVINTHTLPKINAEYTQIFQLFQNIINNSIKYKNQNDDPIINISANKVNDKWQFSISDNGIGINKEYFIQIFEPFKRLHNKEEYSGSGIGLATVKKIISLYNGKIWLESEEGKGSTFYFTLDV